MRGRGRRIVFLSLFLGVEILIWAAPYAGRVYFKYHEAPFSSLVVALPGSSSVLGTIPQFDILEKWAFDSTASLDLWEEKIFKGKTEYRIEAMEEGGSYLRAEAQAASSGLYMKTKHEVTPGLVLSWDWKAGEFPKKNKPGKLADRAQDDFSARVYVIFPGVTFFSSTVIEYLWDENLPEGTLESSPFSDRVKLFVIQKGPPVPKDGGWIHEERDLYADYTALFEEKPIRPIEAIAIMSDSDNTRTISSASFRNFELKLKKTVS